jgi:hypothetical protein
MKPSALGAFSVESGRVRERAGLRAVSAAAKISNVELARRTSQLKSLINAA